MRLPLVLGFTALTFLSWGAYGPTLHRGSEALHHDSLRAFFGVGLAYFLIGVLIPSALLRMQKESGQWTLLGSIFSLLAGSVGAIGALGVILALVYGGSPVFVMPLVFGFAPIVNTVVTATLSRTFNQIRPIFAFGVLAAAVGAAGVLYFKPGPAPSAAKHGAAATSAVEYAPTEQSGEPTSNDAVPRSRATTAVRGAPDSATEDPAQADASTSNDVTDASNATSAQLAGTDDGGEDGKTDPEAASDKQESDGAERAEDIAGATTASTNDPGKHSDEAISSDDKASAAHPADPGAASEASGTKAAEANMSLVILSVALAALCWGSYGPLLHIGQARMRGSRLRPFICVGVAYFIIAVAAPLAIIASRGGAMAIWQGWTLPGLGWSFAAGTAGAIGALGVVLAFNSGGKPYYVMPLVFGFAPVVNTFISLGEADAWDRVPVLFWVCLATVIVGAVTVLVTAPRPKPKPAT